MTGAFKQVYEFEGHQITSVVLDEDEFMELCEEFRGVVVLNEENNEQAADAQIDALKAAKTIPMVGRGTKTEFVFERYNIRTDKACFIVRGHGPTLAEQMGFIESN